MRSKFSGLIWFSGKRGFRMVRLFGFLVAVAAMVSGANAALLAKYDFTSDANSSGGSFGTASAFNAGTAGGVVTTGSVGSDTGVWRAPGSGSLASGTTSNYFTFTATKDVVIESLSFTSKRGGGSTVSTDVNFKVGTGADTNLDTVSIGSTANTTTLDFNPTFVLSAGQTLQIDFVYTGGTNKSVLLGEVALNGSVVPEPTSVAIFAALGLPVAMRRFRRK
jgi:hypothetical protein